MRELGFTPDPSTAGSSVRFDYKDRSQRVSAEPLLMLAFRPLMSSLISLSHSTSVSLSCAYLSTKLIECVLLAHPDPTLDPYNLWNIRKKLQDYYGWTPEKLEMALNEDGGYTSDDFNNEKHDIKQIDL